jgi:hypothetical protein
LWETAAGSAARNRKLDALGEQRNHLIGSPVGWGV